MSEGYSPKQTMLAAVKSSKPVEPSETYMDKRTAVSQSSSEASSQLESLFQQHHDRVFRTAHRMTGSAADAEDVLQTVFLRLVRSTEPLTVPENPNGYFARAAINASLDLLRQRKRSKAVSMDDVENRGAAIELVSRRTPEAGHEDRELLPLPIPLRQRPGPRPRGRVRELDPTGGSGREARLQGRA